MPDMWMDVDTAVTVPVNLLPLIDNGDFKSVEINVAYDAAGMDLVWHFVTTAGVITATAVTPTTGGNYDWAEDVADKGTYKIEIPASGGASINNDAEGFGWFTGVATGVLPWRGPTIGFRAAALNNALIDGGDSLDVNVTEISGDSTAADNCELMFDGTGYAGGTTKLGINLVAILGTALTETAGGYLAAAFKKLFDVLNPTATCLSLPDALPGANGGLPTTNGTKVNQTVDLTGGQSIAASSVPAVTLANGAHGGGAATITLLTPIVANATQIEGGDATDAINAAVDVALNTAIPALPTADSINERIKAIDDKLPSKAYLTGTDNSDGDVEMDDATGNYPGTVATVTTVTNEVSANVTKISGDGTAADNAESFFDGTGYAGTNNTIPTVTTLTNPVTLANGAHGGGAATITLLTPIVANTTQIEGIDATDQIDTRVTAVLNTAIPALPVADSPFERLVALDNHITADYSATEQSAIDLLDDAAGGLLDIHTDVGNVAAGVWDVALAAHVNAGTTGQAQDANIGRYNYNKTTSVEQIQTSLGVVVRTYTVTDTPLVTSKA